MKSGMTLIYKIVTSDQWAEAQDTGLIIAPIDHADGYIHMSTAGQVQGTLDKHFVDQSDLRLLKYADTNFPDTLKWEVSRGDALFPHIYGDVKLCDALEIFDLAPNADGISQAPDGLT